MARRVFFSFHYENDVWRASIVRNSHVVEGSARAGFSDASLWEEAKKKGDAAIRKMIDEALSGTSVTCVLIGSETSSRPWVDYEIRKSVDRGNGLLGIFIDQIEDQFRRTCQRGSVPRRLSDAKARCYAWDRNSFGAWVEDAALAARR